MIARMSFISFGILKSYKIVEPLSFECFPTCSKSLFSNAKTEGRVSFFGTLLKERRRAASMQRLTTIPWIFISNVDANTRRKLEPDAVTQRRDLRGSSTPALLAPVYFSLHFSKFLLILKKTPICSHFGEKTNLASPNDVKET